MAVPRINGRQIKLSPYTSGEYIEWNPFAHREAMGIYVASGPSKNRLGF